MYPGSELFESLCEAQEIVMNISGLHSDLNQEKLAYL